jgi:small conductance mechanosensitive channel
VLHVPIAADADLDQASEAMLQVARQMRGEESWSDVFLDEPEMQGVETLDRDATSGELIPTLRLSAKVRPGEQWRVARELRGRVHETLDRLRISADGPRDQSHP